MTAFILMGVSGSGKSTLGRTVAAELQLPFLEGDDFHPPVNIAKMASGAALTDADRAPWIDALARRINEQTGGGDLIVACSSLSHFVRERLRQTVRQPLHFIFLTAPREVIQRRLDQRGQHFMKPGMLGSQLAALELPQHAVTVDVDRSLEEVRADVIRIVREQSGAR